MKSISAELNRLELQKKCQIGATRIATVQELSQIHDGTYIGLVEQYAKEGGGWLNADTFLSANSYEVARRAAGTAIAAVDAVLKGPDRQSLCLVRPPGHHALVNNSMGFCLFNNIAIAADHAIRQHKLDRVLVIDWDVHHGNGTQDIFYKREDVWFLSVHRSPFYPYTGRQDETGTGKGLGTKFNLPLEFGVSRKEYLARFERILTDAASKCRPQLILISAGFDAHAEDPIGSLGLETEDFERLTKLVVQVAKTHCEGRLVSCLEGGYHFQRLAESVACHLTTLLNS